jgi:hypothetical protein
MQDLGKIMQQLFFHSEDEEASVLQFDTFSHQFSDFVIC